MRSRLSLPYRFPSNFVWGVATAAAQIEGASTAGGKGESIWDRFASAPGNVAGGDTPAVACDHYHRYRQDFALMQKLGYRHHRLSVSWPRVLPSGRTTLNPKGLDFYDRLVDSMLARDITPWITLYHWDLPQALEDEGGWRVRSTAEAFGQYADVVVKRLGDRVKRWITVNEIPCFIGHSYEKGVHAPGACENAAVVNQAYHHALLAHGQAVRAVREHGGRGAQVGLTHNPETGIPVTETPADIAAAQAWFKQRNRHILAPIYQGRYPESYLRAAGADRPRVQPGDLDLISAKTDFLGLNVYSGRFIRAGRKGAPEVLALPRDYPQAGLDWLNIAPQSIYWAVRHAVKGYGVKAVHITENGAGYEEEPDSQGQIVDLHRREYVRSHLVCLHRAVAEKLPLRGYFLWSFLDNYEWAEGYVKRFGIVHNDFRTQKRTPKLSAHWYSQVVRENRVL